MIIRDDTARLMSATPNEDPKSVQNKTDDRPRVRILLADDSPAFLQSARKELALNPDFEIVASVRTGKEALAMTRYLSPHVVFLDLFVVLLDLFVPGQNAMETIVRLKALPHPPKVVILSHRDSDEYRPSIFASGADEFLTKPQFSLLARSVVRKLMANP